MEQQFPHWEKIKDMIDQSIDLMLNLRQSGHPGGSRSKVHMITATLLSGAMRWDIRHPEKRFADRFVLVAGHTVPLIYGALAVLNEAMRLKYEQTGDEKYKIPGEAVYWEDLLTLRHNGGLPGHAEMSGKTLFFKFNTGPSGHGSPAAAGEAAALKLAGLDDVKVFAVEGEGGATAGAIHETMNSAWGLGLNNLHYLLDWNDFGIDNRPFSSVVYGKPEDWFSSHGFRVFGAENGMDWPDVTRAIVEMISTDNPDQRPNMAWFKTRKGREYEVYDNISHGLPHKFNSEPFWKTKKRFMDKYGVSFTGFGEAGPADEAARREQTADHLQKVLSLYEDQEFLNYVADTLVAIGDSVPEEKTTTYFNFTENPFKDTVITDYKNYPTDLFAAPGEKAPNRAGFTKFGAWVNAYTYQKYGRPLVIAMSADLADSTNISGFAKPYGDFKGLGFYDRVHNRKGSLLPQGITEFANAGICAGIATVNLSDKPFEEFNGYYAAASTYGSFSYLKYGLMRLFSQVGQDSEIKVGKVIWVAGHSGPETAEDSRTHFGIFAPGVTQLFPEGQIINLYPWEHNEVAPMLGAAMATDVPIIALHLTRPAVEIPDRKALGIDDYMNAAKGAYLIRDYKPGQPKMGCLFVQGTSTTANVIKILSKLDEAGLNVKLVAAVSPELFAMQPESYRRSIVSDTDWLDSTVVTNAARRTMHDWLSNKIAEEYAISSDWDNRWRTGGSVEEVCEEAHISPDWIFKGIQRFVNDRDQRLGRLRDMLDGAVN
ncbi:MAG: transketolase [Lentisphaeria bacterium]|nr:transketolase [Candidatus Neomarinimicrobiota bacterium]MCF7842986.1 transketolase [Lentisphaeria bacterium]